jgi:hypothetical protein
MTKRISHSVAAALLLTMLAGVAFADDKSYSQVVKHIKSSYRAKQQGFFGAMMLARLAVKIIQPAGVKNFKVTLLRELDYSEGPSPASKEFQVYLREKIAPNWTPLISYSAPRERQWTYVYSAQENDDIKLLVVTVQKQDAVVVQTKFSPAKLAEFMNNPQIMGISLNSDNGQKRQQSSPVSTSGGDSAAASASILSIRAHDMTRLCLIGMH